MEKLKKISGKSASALAVIALTLLFASSARSLRPEIHITVTREPTLYERCVEGTIVPAERLQAHARAESDERDDVPGDNGWSISRFQLYEIPQYHAWRAKRWGEYDPHDPAQAGRIAALYIQDLINEFPGDEEMQITAYRWGPDGARAHGVDAEYVRRVMAGI
jgi:hypothetical protein